MTCVSIRASHFPYMDSMRSMAKETGVIMMHAASCTQPSKVALCEPLKKALWKR